MIMIGGAKIVQLILRVDGGLIHVHRLTSTDNHHKYIIMYSSVR